MTINCEVLSNREEILLALCQAPRDHSPALLTSVDVRFASALGSITTNKQTNRWRLCMYCGKRIMYRPGWVVEWSESTATAKATKT